VPTFSLTSLYASRVDGITGSVIDASTSLLQRQTHDIVRMAMGSPAREAIPSDTFGALLGELSPSAFDYGPTEGEASLRGALVDYVGVDPDELLVTSGGMQGLDLVCKLFVEEGDLVTVEGPTYTNGAATISGYEGRMVEIPGDEDGMDIDALAAVPHEHGETPKLIYTIPTFQNPAGTTLSLERRARLIELAADWGAVVLEDDPYGLLRFEGSDLPTLRELGVGRVRVIGVRTFSKILAPGLRVGWLEAEPEIVARMVDARQGMDTCTAPPMQQLVARFLADGHIDAHLATLRREYHRRKVALQQALHDELSGLDASWTDPHGGFFLWLTLPGVDTEGLFPLALEEGVAYIPGPAFSIGGHFTDALRLAFSAEAPDRAREGVRRLARAIDRLP
jgi:2-aminoadipate transaminase